jgi:hypothetical protein
MKQDGLMQARRENAAPVPRRISIEDQTLHIYKE